MLLTMLHQIPYLDLSGSTSNGRDGKKDGRRWDNDWCRAIVSQK